MTRLLKRNTQHGQNYQCNSSSCSECNKREWNGRVKKNHSLVNTVRSMIGFKELLLHEIRTAFVNHTDRLSEIFCFLDKEIVYRNSNNSFMHNIRNCTLWKTFCLRIYEPFSLVPLWQIVVWNTYLPTYLRRYLPTNPAASLEHQHNSLLHCQPQALTFTDVAYNLAKSSD